MTLGVVSIDFGTTYSGWAYSFYTDYERDPRDVQAHQWNSGTEITDKGPTCVLIRSDGKTVDAFGYDAENKYAELAADEIHRDWYFFENFKMKLFNSEATIGKNTVLEDETGKQLNALTVFSLTIKCLRKVVIKHLKEKLIGNLSKSEINWVITVPAIWDEHAKQFMRVAARKAGIEMGHLSLALEPEAASIFCRYQQMTIKAEPGTSKISTFAPGTQYLVCDAGGGTVDITIHEVTEDMKLKEIEKASGGAWGGAMVNEAFKKFIDTLAGCGAMQALKEKHMDNFIDVMRSFERKKRVCMPSASGSIVLTIPETLKETVKRMTGKSFKEQIEQSPFKGKVEQFRDKLKCDASVISALFDIPVKSIIDHLSTLLSNNHTIPIKHIIMVGGFSDSRLLQEAVRTAFSEKNVTIPRDAGLAVMKGAVIFGHNKRQIVSRIARFTYGIACWITYDASIHPADKVVQEGTHKGKVENGFAKLIEIGQSIPTDKPAGSGVFELLGKHTSFLFRVFGTKAKNPVFVYDDGCFEIGSFRVNCNDKNGYISDTEIKMYFGGTEINVKATLKTTGEEIDATFDLPD